MNKSSPLNAVTHARIVNRPDKSEQVPRCNADHAGGAVSRPAISQGVSRRYGITVALLVTLGFLFVGPSANAAMVYRAGADYDAGFTAGTNPNGVWTYGWSSTLTSGLVTYSRHRLLPSGQGIGNGQFMGWDDPANLAGFTPLVYKNPGAAVADGNIDIPAGALILHGGGVNTNDYSHVVFTAPSAGTYDLSTVFIGSQNAINTDVYVLKNASTLFQDFITFNRDTGAYSTTLALLAGDRIDFAVGTNRLGLHPGSTELQATITLQSPAVAAPEPTSALLLGIGSLGLFCTRNLRRLAARACGRTVDEKGAVAIH